MSKGEFALIGTGEVPCGNFPERTEFEIAYTVARMAIRDAGIDKDRIGAVLGAAHIMGSEYNTEVVFGRLPEALGLLKAQLEDRLRAPRERKLPARNGPLAPGHQAKELLPHVLGLLSGGDGGRVLASGPVGQKVRNGDGRQDADDRDNDHELDKGKTFFIVSHFAKHLNPPLFDRLVSNLFCKGCFNVVGIVYEQYLCQRILKSENLL